MNHFLSTWSTSCQLDLLDRRFGCKYVCFNFQFIIILISILFIVRESSYKINKKVISFNWVMITWFSSNKLISQWLWENNLGFFLLKKNNLGFLASCVELKIDKLMSQHFSIIIISSSNFVFILLFYNHFFMNGV